MNKKSFVIELEKAGISLSDEQINQLDIYAKFLLEYNKTTNLTAIKDIDSVYLKHFFDCSIITKYYDFNNVTNLLDIGTGAGFPGIVLKILFPGMKITLLDSNNKKIRFLESIIEKLQLKKIELIYDRAENYIKKHREEYDLVISRAVADLSVLIELGLPFVKVEKDFLAMKGNPTIEIKDSIFAIGCLGGNLKDIIQFNLPIEKSARSIVIIKKIKPTNNSYPREYDKIIKKPLKKIDN